jgi:hypothetical protein
MHILSVVSSYAVIVTGLSCSAIMYRHRTRKDKAAQGIADPWRPYLWTIAVIAILVATARFILLTTHH